MNKTPYKYQKFFLANKPMAIISNSIIASVYVILDGKDVDCSVEEIYDPGWPYEFSLKSENSTASVAEHGFKSLSMTAYSLVFLLGGFVFGTVSY